MSDVGDTETLTLTVNPHDGSTAATVTATSPTGATSTLSTSTADGGATWTALLPLTVAGAWTVVWSVTGQGYGVQTDTVYAFAPIAGRTYATLSDLAAYLAVEPPDGAARILVQATRLVDTLLVGAVYNVDDLGMPLDARAITALRDATCAQVEWMDETGDTTGSSGGYTSVSVGNVSLSRGGGRAGGGAERIAPDAVNILRLAGMLPVRPYLFG